MMKYLKTFNESGNAKFDWLKKQSNERYIDLMYILQSDLFDEKERLSLVKDLSNQNRFFHTQLEFIEVFLEKGGFDIIVGNPPWVNIIFDEGGVHKGSKTLEQDRMILRYIYSNFK